MEYINGIIKLIFATWSSNWNSYDSDEDSRLRFDVNEKVYSNVLLEWNLYIGK